VFKALIQQQRFTCTQCGKCCTGEGEVWISDKEGAAIAAHLGMPLNRFHKQHTHAHSSIEGFRLLRTQANEVRVRVLVVGGMGGGARPVSRSVAPA
jgi:hypothetical protein